MLRAGKLQGVRGPGLFVIVPVIDRVVALIDERIQTMAFNAEWAFTRDTVPVNVDAIIFWHVHDARQAALAITDYRQAIDRVAQSSLREMIGSSMLSSLLCDRRAADLQLSQDIGARRWSGGSRCAPSRSATWRSPKRCRTRCRARPKAEREKQARVVLGAAEAEIAGKFVAGTPTARHEHHLRDDQGAGNDDLDSELEGGEHESAVGDRHCTGRQSARGRNRRRRPGALT